MSRKRIGAFIATSHPIAAYGGVRLPPEAMETLAHDVRTGGFPFAYEHDPRFPTDVNVLEVEVRDMDDGHRGVWVEMDVDEEEFESRGVRGFSIAMVEPIKKLSFDDDRPRISISADSAHFDDAAILGAAGSLEGHFAVDAGRLYQFSVVPPATVAIEMAVVVLQAVPPGLVSAGLYDALKTWLLHPKKASKTVFSFRFRGQGGYVQAHFETDDAGVVKEALSTMRDVVLASRLGEGHEFDTSSRRWRKLR